MIKQAQALYNIDGSPVILMDGTTPVYRDLTAGITDGQDVLQLNADLVALGFNPDGIVVDDEWQTATTDGVEAFQDSLGETETGDLTRGRLIGGGTEGNEQLTAITGAILLVLLAVIGLTILRIHLLISVHLFVGLLLIGPVALKLGSTGYRFARHYSACVGTPAGDARLAADRSTRGR